MIYRILKTAIQPFSEFIFEYLLVLPLPAAKNAKSLFKYRNSSGNDADYCADDNQFCHLSKVTMFFLLLFADYMSEKEK